MKAFPIALKDFMLKVDFLLSLKVMGQMHWGFSLLKLSIFLSEISLETCWIQKELSQENNQAF
jgi:hypothetical protein